jgi:hypothetical protein
MAKRLEDEELYAIALESLSDRWGDKEDWQGFADWVQDLDNEEGPGVIEVESQIGLAIAQAQDKDVIAWFEYTPTRQEMKVVSEITDWFMSEEALGHTTAKEGFASLRKSVGLSPIAVLRGGKAAGTFGSIKDADSVPRVEDSASRKRRPRMNDEVIAGRKFGTGRSATIDMEDWKKKRRRRQL